MSKDPLWGEPILLIKEVIRHLNFFAITLPEGKVHRKRRVKLSVGNPRLAAVTIGVGEIAKFSCGCLLPFVVNGESRVAWKMSLGFAEEPYGRPGGGEVDAIAGERLSHLLG